MRLLGVLAIAAPVAVALLILTDPGLTSSWVDGGDRAEAAAATAVLIGIGLTATLSWIIVRIRFGRLVRAAERIAGGDYTVSVPSDGGGLEAASRRPSTASRPRWPTPTTGRRSTVSPASSTARP